MYSAPNRSACFLMFSTRSGPRIASGSPARFQQFHRGPRRLLVFSLVVTTLERLRHFQVPPFPPPLDNELHCFLEHPFLLERIPQGSLRLLLVGVDSQRAPGLGDRI